MLAYLDINDNYIRPSRWITLSSYNIITIFNLEICKTCHSVIYHIVTYFLSITSKYFTPLKEKNYLL